MRRILAGTAGVLIAIGVVITPSAAADPLGLIEQGIACLGGGGSTHPAAILWTVTYPVQGPVEHGDVGTVTLCDNSCVISGGFGTGATSIPNDVGDFETGGDYNGVVFYGHDGNWGGPASCGETSAASGLLLGGAELIKFKVTAVCLCE